VGHLFKNYFLDLPNKYYYSNPILKQLSATVVKKTGLAQLRRLDK